MSTSLRWGFAGCAFLVVKGHVRRGTGPVKRVVSSAFNPALVPRLGE